MNKITVKKLVTAALLMGMTVIMSMSTLSIPVPGGHLYLNDAIIVTAAVLLGPGYAAAVGGLGAFLGDLLFYPAPMFVSLVTHGIEALVISLFVHVFFKKKPVLGSILGALAGLVITVAGYTFGRAFIYGTPEAALLKLPYQILQGAAGSAIALILCWPLRLVALYRRIGGEDASA